MKNIHVLIHDDPGQEARLCAALALVRACEGHLTCVDVAIVPPTIGTSEWGDVGAMLVEEAVHAEQSNRARIEPRLLAEGIAYDWVEMTGDAADCLLHTARLADLIVVNTDVSDRAYPDMFAITSELIASGRIPVLAVPERMAGFDPCGNAVIAWDGSPDAEAALRAALPLLQRARAVSLFYVNDGSIAIPTREAAAWLSRNGVHAVIREQTPLLDKPQALIQAECEVAGADYLVMGGFSRSRWREAAFGGATNHLLRGTGVPLLIAHR